MGRTHTLKTWPSFFVDVEAGRKKFEVRRNDRDFAVGDLLLLKEYDPSARAGFKLSGRQLLVRVTYLLQRRDLGIEDGYCVMGIERHDREEAGDG